MQNEKMDFVKMRRYTGIQVADCVHNTGEIIEKAKEMSRQGAGKLCVPRALYYRIYLSGFIL